MNDWKPCTESVLIIHQVMRNIFHRDDFSTLNIWAIDRHFIQNIKSKSIILLKPQSCILHIELAPA